MIAQVATLALAAGRFPLSAHFFEPAERMAVEELLVLQLLVASLAFPLLLQTIYSALAVLVTAPAMLLVANALSRYPIGSVLPAVAYVELVILALATWAQALQSLRGQVIGLCVASGLTVFATVLWYLSREYRPESNDWLQYVSPIVAALRVLDQSGKIWAFAVIPLAIWLVGVIVLLAHRRPARTP